MRAPRPLLLAGALVTAALTVRTLVRRARRFSLAGKSVLFTGGSRELGLVLARQRVASQSVLALAARLLPGMGGIGERSAYGYKSTSRWPLGALSGHPNGDRAAQRNNEMHGTFAG